jgi:peptidoglycan/LPS O-acetylase OafA/YrhL
MLNGSPRHRIAYVDGLRAVAVLLVVAFHAAKYSGMSPAGPMAPLLRAGSHGVDLFFVLSGFCLSYPTLARLHRDGDATFDVVRFAAHRVVRIVPPYYFAIAFFVVFAMVLGALHLPLPEAMPRGGISPGDVAMQVLFLDGAGVKFLNGSFWTLPVEFRWYFLFPIVLWVWTKSPKAFAFIMAAAATLFLTRGSNVDVFVLPAFMLGIVAASLHIWRIRLGWWPGFACVVVLLAAFATMAQTGWTYDFNPLWYLSAFAFVLAAGGSGQFSALLSVRAVTVVGFASYSIYLVHEPLIAFAQEHGLNPYAAAALGIAAGFAFWAVFERPFVEGSARRRLLSEFENVFGRWISRAGIPRSFVVGSVPQAPMTVRATLRGSM